MSYLESLRAAPEPLTSRQRWLVLALSILVAVTRLLTVSRTLHDWDEALFVLGVREYDVFQQRPHPPGYPLFMLAGNAANLLIRSEFRAVQSIVVLAAILLFPTVFFFARELRLSFRAALIGAAFTAFLPSVWYYGGTGLSDVPALVAVIFAGGLFLRGGRSSRAYILGALVLAAAAGIRPQIVLLAVPCALAGAVARPSRRAVAGAAMTFLVATAITYGGAATFTIDTPNGFLKSVRHQSTWVRNVDSYANPGRPPLEELAFNLLLHPVLAGRVGRALRALALFGALASLIRSRGPLLILLTMFVPTALLTWTMLDFTAIGRYSIAYAPLYTLFAAIGVDMLARALPVRWMQSAVAAALALGMTVALVQWAWPTLRLAATTEAPHIAALRAVRAVAGSRGGRTYVHSGLTPHAAVELEGLPYEIADDSEKLPDDAFRRGNTLVRLGLTGQKDGRAYVRKRGRLWHLARPRFFEASVLPMESVIRFGEGWWGEEWSSDQGWRWKSQRSRALIPIVAGKGQLEMDFVVPLDGLPSPPNIMVLWNGETIERIHVTSDRIRLRYVLPSRGQGANELQIVSDSFVNPKALGQSEDSRDLALMLTSYRWTPVRIGASK